MRDERLMPAHIKTSLPVGVNEHLGKPLHKTIFFGTKDQILVSVLRSFCSVSKQICKT
jgi:hypothetical protein